MIKLIFKIVIFLIPIVLYLVVNLSLPINYFAFRFMEPAVVYHKSRFLAGPFYPRQKIAMYEEGDLGHGTKYAIKRYVAFATDKYGYRKDTSSENDIPAIVIIGDSNTAGCGLDQKEILSEVIEAKIKTRVYPYAPDSIDNYVSDNRFSLQKPKIVIFQIVERNLPKIADIKIGNKRTVIENPLVVRIAIAMDRITKNEAGRYLFSKLTGIGGVSSHIYNDIMFLEGEKAYIDPDEKRIDKIAKTIVNYKNYFNSQGIEFIFLPVPNKETILYSHLPGKSRSPFLQKLLARLQGDVITIDTLGLFDKAVRDGNMVYQIDDTHWNSFGVRLVADDIIRRIKRNLPHLLATGERK